ncbi:MAG: NTPase [Candidatus Bathyarchaeota archaeon]|nr:MAG: NTPase [Candidatus Bathyarchaeota archaeon]
MLITGRPGIGKTSVLLKAMNVLKTKGYKVGGMVSREVRKSGVRVGFEIVDFETGRKGWLAHVNHPTGPRVGKYHVNLKDLNVIGASSILNAVANADVVVVDEIGPMELFSPAFKEAVAQAINSEKPMLGTVHHKARDSLITAIRAREDAKIFEVTYENREGLHNLIIDKVVNFLQKLS